jgi:hypothetical protein
VITKDAPAEGILSALDAGKANIARVYDALLGGKDNYAADRAEAARLLALYPDLRQKARENRLFLAAAARWLAAECGIRQYLDLGSGLPADGSNTHQVVHAVSPACGVAYVDIDPVAVAHADALLAKSKRVQAVRGDLADPAAILAEEKVRRVIDLSEPVTVILAMVLHFFDAETAAQIVAGYMAAVAPGSYLVISAGSGDKWTGGLLAREYKAGALYNHSPERIAGWFSGLELIDPPGLVDARAWQPGTPAAPPSAEGGHVLAGVARKPEDTARNRPARRRRSLSDPAGDDVRGSGAHGRLRVNAGRGQGADCWSGERPGAPRRMAGPLGRSAAD